MNEYLIECLKRGRKRAGLTQADVAKKLNIKRSTLGGYESGNSSPDLDIYMQLCKLYGLDYISIFNKAYEMTPSQSQIEVSMGERVLIQKYRSLSPYEQETVEIIIDRFVDNKPTFAVEENPLHYVTLPMFGYSPSAGSGNYMPDDIPSSPIRIPETGISSKADFIVRVGGHSMEPKFQDGDLVLVKKTDSIDIGKVGVFSVNGEALIKECQVDRLHSLNPDYEDIYLNNDDSVICWGEVIGKV